MAYIIHFTSQVAGAMAGDPDFGTPWASKEFTLTDGC